jgi:hypothetical protein
VRRFHRSKGASSAALALAAAVVACSRSPEVTTRTVTLHTPRACAVGASAYAQYFELGDFDPTAPSGGHVLDQAGATLDEIDPAARALVVEATQDSRTWSGVAAMPPAGDVDVLALPGLSSCALSGSVGARAGALFATLSGGLALVVGGGTPGDPHPATFVADLGTGVVARLSAPDLGAARSGATLTAFGGGALVAGGRDAAGQAPKGTAERFSIDGGFDQQHPILLSEARADHGAVVLATGQTLLVGGVGADGTTMLGSMDLVDPVTGTAQEQSVAVLAVPRRLPKVLRLASGEVLVAGGFDANGNPVPTIEWLSADASHASRAPRDLVAGAARDFVALPAGGALAVVAPPPGASSSFANVWVIGADGAFAAATELAGVTAPVLFPGAGGAPVLWTGPGGRWLRWQPWQGAFGALGVLDATPADVSSSNASGDPGLAMWLDGSTSALNLLRYDTRGAYSTLSGPLLAGTSGDVAPDRLPADGVAAFDPATGLTLGPGTSAFVTDRTYADVAVALDAPTGEPAILVLRDEHGTELEVGGTTCPGPLARSGAPSTLEVRRTGSTVSWAIAKGTTGTCATAVGAGARLSIGVRAPGGVTRSVVRNLTVSRLGS